MDRFNFKNLFRLDAVNRFFEDLLEKEIPGLVLDYTGSRSTFQGIDIVEAVGKTAEQKKIVISKSRIFIHECYVVYLAPKDHQRFAPLFPELEADILDHLDQLKDSRQYQTKGPFEVQFLENPKVPEGRCQVVSSPKKMVAHTVLQIADLPEETPLNWSNSVFELDRDQDKLMSQAFKAIENGNLDKAVSLLERFNREFPKMTVGRTIYALVHCIAGRWDSAKACIQEGEKKHAFPLAREIKSLLFALQGDMDQAESNLTSSEENPFSDISLFVSSLLHSLSGRQKKADGLLALALAMNSELVDLAGTVFGESHISKIQKQSLSASPVALAPQNFSLPQGCFRLAPAEGEEHIVLAFLQKADLIFPQVVSRLKTVYFRSAGALCPPGFDQVAIEIENGQLSFRFNAQSRQIATHGCTILKGPWSWTYEKIIFQGIKKQNSQRDFKYPCHILAIFNQDKPVETWVFPEDAVVTVGRESGQGNDWSLHDRSITGIAHGEWRYDSGHLSFFDLGSTNGTAKNGKKFSGLASINQGDLIQIGKASFKISAGG